MQLVAFSVGLFANLFVRVISGHYKFTVSWSLKPTIAGCLSVRDTYALTGDGPSISSPPGAPSGIKAEALKHSLCSGFWGNMAPGRPKHTARVYPLNPRLPPAKSVITVKYESLEVDTDAVAPASLRSCNAGQGSCFTLQQRSPAPGKRGVAEGSSRHKCMYTCTNRHGEGEMGRGEE